MRRDLDDRRERVTGLGVERGRAQDEADQPAHGEQAVARHGRLEGKQDDSQDQQQEPGRVERQAAEANEGEDDRQAAEDPGDEVRVHQLVEQAQRADAEQQRGDVRV